MAQVIKKCKETECNQCGSTLEYDWSDLGHEIVTLFFTLKAKRYFFMCPICNQKIYIKQIIL